MYQYKKNVYTCTNFKCEKSIVTVDRDPGVTPFMTTCPYCYHTTQSGFYRCNQSLTPTHEWYRPSVDKYNKLEQYQKDHVLKGGLLLREVEIFPATTESFEKLFLSGKMRS